MWKPSCHDLFQSWLLTHNTDLCHQCLLPLQMSTDIPPQLQTTTTTQCKISMPVRCSLPCFFFCFFNCIWLCHSVLHLGPYWSKETLSSNQGDKLKMEWWNNKGSSCSLWLTQPCLHTENKTFNKTSCTRILWGGWKNIHSLNACPKHEQQVFSGCCISSWDYYTHTGFPEHKLTP